ncbi:long-chain fatty acid--CoA ligase [Planococcus sp. ANT_H30]|uniref:class I adenylate-forming enzyme family protein n=1 Tax=Planococcus sp. ANT_H30 TaxID=2597347 RepID=UPI0011EDC55D|nr:long-chain-fatty-acid--CoA ligase [Planococcus sp. ANT_H30]KAA0959001.1 long-chain fatty acid--CoA ligase [Planococcus sp. ANT_H30]
MNIVSILAQNALRHPDKPALVFEDRSYTYHEFNKMVNQLANGLIALGIQKGEKIALMMKNSDYFAISYYAVAKAGAVVVPMNFRLVAREANYILEQSNSVFVICDQEYEKMIHDASRTIPAVRQVITVETAENKGSLSLQDVLSKNSAEPAVEINNTDDLHILYTSGTTGNPKGAVFDHQRVLNVTVGCIGLLGYNTRERFIHVAPLFHAAQLVICMTSSFLLGGFNVIHKEFNPEAMLRDIEKYKITSLFAIPTMFKFLIEFPGGEKYDVSSIQRFLYGAAPMSREMVNQTMKFFNSNNFYSLCGLTEGGPSGIYLSPEDHKEKVGASGKDGLLFTEAKLVTPEGQETEPNVVGEFVLKGDTVMKEYYKKPQETAATLRDGWLYTGDLGYRDKDGYIYIVDRIKDMIITGGENVYSVEVENVLGTHPKIADVAVIGSPDEQWGEIVTAVIASKPNETIELDELEAFCRQHLSGYKIPRKVVFVEALPRNTSGKLMKYKLRESVKK